MRTFIFHVPFLISERVISDDYPGATEVVDLDRQHMDAVVYATDLETAKSQVAGRLQTLLAGEDKEPDTLPDPTLYVGPV